MADRGGRGGGSRGKRGDDRGRGGSRGRGRGDGEGGRGRGRGDGEGSRGRGRGRGDGERGAFRGGFSGRGDARGGSRGGRGGRGGYRREASPGKSMTFSYDGTIPAPDPEVTQLEDAFIQESSASLSDLTKQMKNLDVKKSKQQTPGTTADHFPVRPAFGSKGRAVVLWTNYFCVNAKPVTLYKYTLDAVQVPRATDDAAPKQKGKGGAGGSGSGGGGGSAAPREVKGRKLFLAIRETLNQLSAGDQGMVLASEYKSQLITVRELDLSTNPVRVSLPMENRPEIVDDIDVTIHGPTVAPVEALLQYLKSMKDSPEAPSYPRYPEVVDALNVILGHQARSQLDKITAMGGSRFFPFGDGEKVQNLFSDCHAIVAARGAFQSARLGTGRLLLNTNVTHAVFRVSGRLHEIMGGFSIKAVPKTDRRGTKQLKAFAKFLPKARVWVTFKLANGKELRKSKVIHNLAMSWDFRRSGSGDHPPKFQDGYEFGGPKNVSFWQESEKGGRYVKVYDYFKEKYGVSLGDYPLVNVGSAAKPTFFPAETVEIQPGQPVKAKLTGSETTAMLDFACRSPYANALTISTGSRETLGLDNNNELDKFGISVDKKLLTVHGRVLSAPRISYVKNDGKGKFDMVPNNGSWNMRSVRVTRPGRMIERWSWVNVLMRGNEEPVDGGVVKDFAKFMNSEMGIHINKSPIFPPAHAMTPDKIDRLFEWAQEQNLQFLLIVLSEKDTTGLYARIKTLGDCTYGIQTSCVLGKNFRKAQLAYFANVGLKWNLKAGGVNHKLSDETGILKDGKTMVAGYDVTHPTNMPVRKDSEPPSLVGLVASVDRDLGQWPAVAWEQASRQEMLDDVLVDAFKSRLGLWAKHNDGHFPDNIVIFRDGVSEGQYAQVLEQEVPSIRLACKDTYPKQKSPKITIVVSVKRHQTRFYPTDKEDMSSSGNIRNGTVVDRGVTQVRYWDFFLTAHDALKGTARSAHYTVLLDEIFRAKFGAEAANQLENLTHELCYLFGRATKAVSICPPAYYADIVCERARAHRPEHFDVSDIESVTTASGPASTTVGGGKQVHDALKDTMYYI